MMINSPPKTPLVARLHLTSPNLQPDPLHTRQNNNHHIIAAGSSGIKSNTQETPREEAGIINYIKTGRECATRSLSLPFPADGISPPFFYIHPSTSINSHRYIMPFIPNDTVVHGVPIVHCNSRPRVYKLH